MTISQIIHSLLVSDEQLVSLVGYTPKNKRISAMIPNNREDYPYIVFEISPYEAGEVDTYRCDIRIVSKNVVEMEKIAKRVIDLLHFRAKDKPFTVNDVAIYYAKHIGGGVLYVDDLNVYEQLLIFHIKVKEMI
ncbi:hypothetical protein [Saccharococcus thermophilus]|uniref:DUF3168 domain-containing protein n=1 Tax=Saccharococcus thermophilus TaxID=29396 RepID=A0A846MI85_9BACL|nr:hypothetical protein [Saccharococcus thermophilus]NIK15294.1 hypothetical protein [Saccharococcus thermophilus]